MLGAEYIPLREEFGGEAIVIKKQVSRSMLKQGLCIVWVISEGKGQKMLRSGKLFIMQKE